MATTHGVDNARACGTVMMLLPTLYNQLRMGSDFGVLPIVMDESFGILTCKAPSNSCTHTLKPVMDRPTELSFRICVWLPHTHITHSPYSSRSTTFLLMVDALVLIGNTAITTAERVRFLFNLSLGIAVKSHVKSCNINQSMSTKNFLQGCTDESGLAGDCSNALSAGLPLGIVRLFGDCNAAICNAWCSSLSMGSAAAPPTTGADFLATGARISMAAPGVLDRGDSRLVVSGNTAAGMLSGNFLLDMIMPSAF